MKKLNTFKISTKKTVKNLIILLIIISLLAVLLTSCLSKSAFEKFDKLIGRWQQRFYYELRDGISGELLVTQYRELFDKELERLLTKYELTEHFIEVTATAKNYYVEYQFRSKECTLMIEMYTRYGYAFYDAHLYYYKPVGKTLDFSQISAFVGLLNDFTNYAAFAAITDQNEFELLFYEALNADDGLASCVIYEDGLIGSMWYSVALDRNNAEKYRLGNDDGREMDCYAFAFDGLLKLQNISEE